MEPNRSTRDLRWCSQEYVLRVSHLLSILLFLRYTDVSISNLTTLVFGSVPTSVIYDLLRFSPIEHLRCLPPVRTVVEQNLKTEGLNTVL